jgi:hypothetical protein
MNISTEHGPFRKLEKGQALAETAIISVAAMLLLVGIISLVPLGRARTAATSAAFACAEFLSQNPDPVAAKTVAYQAAMATLQGGWGGTGTANFQISVVPPTGRGAPGTCSVRWTVAVKFLPLSIGGSTEQFTSRSETWRSKW